MKVHLTRIGILESYLPPACSLEWGNPDTLRDLLDFLAYKWGRGLIEELMEGDQLKPHIVILLNGRSVRALPEGINSPIKDGDHIVFSIMIDGG